MQTSEKIKSEAIFQLNRMGFYVTEYGNIKLKKRVSEKIKMPKINKDLLRFCSKILEG